MTKSLFVLSIDYTEGGYIFTVDNGDKYVTTTLHENDFEPGNVQRVMNGILLAIHKEYTNE